MTKSHYGDRPTHLKHRPSWNWYVIQR